MIAALIIVFRELIEAGLVVGIVMAATRGVTHRTRWVAFGIIAGVIGSCIVALFADAIGKAMEGYGQEYFNAGILILAVLMLTWHNVWMAKHGRAIAAEMKEVGAEVSKGKRSLTALSIVVGVAVLREGSEIVLFLYGIIVAGNDSTSAMVLGSLLGLLAGATMSVLMYLGLLRIPAGKLFSVTSWLIALLAAGMAAQAISFLQQAGTITILTNTIWDTSHILSDRSILGKALHTLVGYSAKPNELQLIVYVLTLAVIFTLMKLFKPQSRSKQVSAAAQAAK